MAAGKSRLGTALAASKRSNGLGQPRKASLRPPFHPRLGSVLLLYFVCSFIVLAGWFLWYAHSGGDTRDLHLDANDEKLINAMAVAGRRIVVLLLCGRPLVLKTELLAKIAALEEENQQLRMKYEPDILFEPDKLFDFDAADAMELYAVKAELANGPN